MLRKIMFMALILIVSSLKVDAHCDGLDGPVIKAADKALGSGNINYVLIWVNEKSEGELKKEFNNALKARTLNEKAKHDADYSFYEVLVKLHRETEGEEFTGVKPAGRYTGTVIPLADEAIEKNSMEPMKKILKEQQIMKLKKYFDAVIRHKNYKTDDIAAGRKYVASYVQFFHHLEHLTDNHNEG